MNHICVQNSARVHQTEIKPNPCTDAIPQSRHVQYEMKRVLAVACCVCEIGWFLLFFWQIITLFSNVKYSLQHPRFIWQLLQNSLFAFAIIEEVIQITILSTLIGPHLYNGFLLMCAHEKKKKSLWHF